MVPPAPHDDAPITLEALRDAVVESDNQFQVMSTILTVGRALTPSAESARLCLRTWPARMPAPTAEDYEVARIGLAHLASIGTPALFDELLEGLTLEGVTDAGEIYQALAIPSGWGYGHLRTFITHHILALAPEACSRWVSLRDGVESVSLNGDYCAYGWDREFSVQLAPLATFTNLRRVEAFSDVRICGLPELAPLKSLELLDLHGEVGGEATLSELLRDPTFLPSLRRLSVNTAIDLGALSGRPLEALRLRTWTPGTEEALCALSELRRLELSHTLALEHLEGLNALEHLFLGGKCSDRSTVDDCDGIDVLARLPALRSARLPLGPMDDDLAWLDSHPTLKALQLSCQGKRHRKYRKRLSQRFDALTFVRS